MVVSVTLRQLSFLLGRDFLSLPEGERLPSLAAVFHFLGKVTGVELSDSDWLRKDDDGNSRESSAFALAA